MGYNVVVVCASLALRLSAKVFGDSYSFPLICMVWVVKYGGSSVLGTRRSGLGNIGAVHFGGNWFGEICQEDGPPSGNMIPMLYTSVLFQSLDPFPFPGQQT